MKEIKINSVNEVIYTFNAPTNLPVYMWVNKDKNNVHLSLVVKYGSSGTDFTCNNVKYSVPTGTAHFLEHIKFHLKDDNASNLLYDLGCDSNAYTSLNETSFEVFASDNVYEATKILLNFVYDNYFSKKIVDNERGIILEECNSHKDDPDYELYIETMKNYLVKSTCRNPVIGYEKDVKRISVDDVSLVHDYFYRPTNMFMVITGNFDPEEMKKVINENEKDRTFKDIGNVKIDRAKEPKGFLNDNVVLYNKNCANTQGSFVIKTLKSSFKGYTKDEILVALRTIVNANFDLASDFYETIIQEGFATRFSSYVSYDDGAFGISFNYFSEDPEKVIELINDKLNNMTITKEDIDRIIKSYLTNSIMRFDNIYNVSAFIIASIIDDDYVNENKLDIRKKLSVKKIKDIYNKVDLKNTMNILMKQKK